MPTYKELFGREVCSCGNKGTYIIPNGQGGVRGFICEECKKNNREKVISDIKGFVHEFFNEYDQSVGLFPVGKIDADIVKDINDNVYDVNVVAYSDYLIKLESDGIVFTVEPSKHSDNWEITKIHA